jgi:hypothetical protein
VKQKNIWIDIRKKEKRRENGNYSLEITQSITGLLKLKVLMLLPFFSYTNSTAKLNLVKDGERIGNRTKFSILKSICNLFINKNFFGCHQIIIVLI